MNGRPARGTARRVLAWGAVFAGLFVLSLDYWTWDDPVRLGPLGLPVWVYYFVGLQLALAGALHVFGRGDGRRKKAEGRGVGGRGAGTRGEGPAVGETG